MVEFTSTIRNWGTKECRNLKTPKLTNAMWGAGLSFHRCHAEINVPVDPYLDGVFDGEEVRRSKAASAAAAAVVVVVVVEASTRDVHRFVRLDQR
jgi:hypothetical protein